MSATHFPLNAPLPQNPGREGQPVLAARRRGLCAMAWESPAGDTRIAFDPQNRKREGTASYLRYEKYKKATSYPEFMRLGGGKRDFQHDEGKGWVKRGAAAPALAPAPGAAAAETAPLATATARACATTESPAGDGDIVNEHEAHVEPIEEWTADNYTPVTRPAQIGTCRMNIMLFGDSAITSGAHVNSRATLL